MDTNPKVSIIIPVYNGANYLSQAIDSALAQIYTNLEILVIDDGSTDEGKTEQIARSYGNKIRYILKENGGVSTALNRGIQEMTGEWFSWLSHDDLYLPEKIERQISFLKDNPKVKIMACNLNVIDDAGKIIFESVNRTHPVVCNGRDALEVWLYGCGLLIHKDCFDKVGLFNNNNKTTQDVEMWLKLIRHYPIYFVDQVLCHWRQHAQSGSAIHSQQKNHDMYYYFKWLSEEFPITWFFPSEVSEKVDSKRYRSKAYNWLGNYALDAGSFDGAKLFYKLALQVYPSPLNPALFKVMIGMHSLNCIISAARQIVRNRAPRLIKLFKRISTKH
jgi:glycosyltransferase involved in cell wall biosynthesis